MNVVYIILQIIVMLLLSPLVNGIIKKVKAFSQKRKGAPVLQTYYDLFKLYHKEVVVSETSSWIFSATPYIVFTSTLAASLLVPVTLTTYQGPVMGDAILIIYLLAMAKFFMMLSGLDPATTFGGMGSSREGMISALMEPAFMVVIFTMGLLSGNLTIGRMFFVAAEGSAPLLHPAYVLCLLAMLIVLIAETSRIPVDDPATHLELTMVHEAMLLEYSGRHLALMEHGAALKQLIIMTMIVNLYLPHEYFVLYYFGGALAVIVSILIYILKIIICSVAVAIFEVFTVKYRLLSVPNLAVLSFMLALLGFVNSFILGR